MNIYEMESESVAIMVWEISTDNGNSLDQDNWDGHMQNCWAAAHNSYVEGIDMFHWVIAACNLIGIGE